MQCTPGGGLESWRWVAVRGSFWGIFGADCPAFLTGLLLGGTGEDRAFDIATTLLGCEKKKKQPKLRLEAATDVEVICWERQATP